MAIDMRLGGECILFLSACSLSSDSKEILAAGVLQVSVLQKG